MSEESPPQTVLVVEDEFPLQQSMMRTLEAAGYGVEASSDARGARATMWSRRVDLVLLDLMLPDDDGLDLLEEMRRELEVPVIVVSGRTSEGDRVVGLEAGADDYVVKPFSRRELVARVRAVLRRTSPPERPAHLRAGELEIDLPAAEVRVGGQLTSLTSKEFDLLTFFVLHPRQVLGRDELLRRVWRATPAFLGPATVTEHVRRLRMKIEQDRDHPRQIVTVPGGYRFDP